MDFPEDQRAADTQAMLHAFSDMRSTSAKFRATVRSLKSLPGVDTDKLQELDECFFCFDLAMTYYEEANRALQAEAWFAGSAVAAAALEAVLLAKCFLERDKIRALPKWRTLKKSQKERFTVFVRSLDLGKLLDIAQQLHWFPDEGMPKLLREILIQQISHQTVRDLEKIVDGEGNIGQACAKHLREYRNLLHPAVCLKEDRTPTPHAGLTATFLFLVAFTALTQQVV